MKEQLDLLYELQQIDTRIDASTKHLEALDDGAGKRESLGIERAHLADLESALEDSSTKQLDRELELESTEEERAEKWSRAYGGTVSDPKELASLEKKIEELDRRRDKLEDQLLALYDAVEEQTRRRQQQRDTVAQLENEIAGIERAFEADSAELNAAIAQAQDERAEIISQLNTDLVAMYENIREKNDGLAVVEVNDRLCTGCRVSISVMLLDQLHSGKKIVRCENCRRILYYKD
jgi:uncharacterized protein